MKQFYALTLSVLLLSCFHAIAGEHGQGIYKKFPTSPNTGHKGTVIAQRYLAAAYYQSDGTVLVPGDSSYYTYLDAVSTRVLVDIDYLYNGSTWAPGYKTTYTYDGNNFVIQRIDENWNSGTSAYDKSAQYTFINNAAGYETDIVVKYWDASSSTYINQQHDIIARNSASFITDHIVQQWKSGAWRNYSHDANVLNAQNNRTSGIHQTWDTVANVWVNKTKYSTVYDASGLHTTSDTVNTWNATAGTWKNNSIDIYYLNASGNADSTLERLWSTAGSGSYYDYQRTTSTYDGSGNLTTDIVEYYDGTTWTKFYKALYTYTSANQLASNTVLMWASGSFGTSSGSYRTTYYFETYSPTGVAVQNNTNTKLSIYPNPAKDVLTVSIKWEEQQDFTAIITDIQGKAYQQFSGIATRDFSKAISVAEMPAGNYMLSVKGTKDAGGTQMLSVVH